LVKTNAKAKWMTSDTGEGELRGCYVRPGHLRDEPVGVLGLPRGGAPVALEVAQALGAPLDVIVVRRLGCQHRRYDVPPVLALVSQPEGELGLPFARIGLLVAGHDFRCCRHLSSSGCIDWQMTIRHGCRSGPTAGGRERPWPAAALNTATSFAARAEEP
jgi:hypothetical protein